MTIRISVLSVMPRIEAQSWLPKPWVIAAVLVGAALVVVMVGFAAYLRKSATNADSQQFKELISETSLMGGNAKYAQAAQLWLAYASQTPSKSHREAAYVSAATFYLSNHQYAQAITMCKRAQGVEGITYTEATAAALAYRSSGDSSQAIYYYREAIKLVPPDEMDRTGEISLYQQAIQELQAKS
jgi:tetratricopeptide (TPR) repeat protein